MEVHHISDLQAGIALLEPAGLTYDLLLFPRHIPPAIRLVDAFPTQRFVVDYIAKPAIVTDYVDRLSSAERAAILGGNCALFYGLVCG